MRYSTDMVSKILTSPEGRTTLGFVSPIYGQSYVGLWIFQVIGLELDDLRGWTNDLKNQMFPQTATWALPYWEAAYGITPTETETDADRQREILSKIQQRAPVNPKKMARLVSAATGRPVTILERVAKRTFEVEIDISAGGDPFDLDFYKKIDIIKPAHLIYRISFKIAGTITVGYQNGVYYFSPPACGTLLCGTYPSQSTIGNITSGTLQLENDSVAAAFDSPACGTLPSISTVGVITSATLSVTVTETPVAFAPPACGTIKCGVYPQ